MQVYKVGFFNFNCLSHKGFNLKLERCVWQVMIGFALLEQN
jgi:hypothetical protein